jgi:hypothetical protein
VKTVTNATPTTGDTGVHVPTDTALVNFGPLIVMIGGIIDNVTQRTVQSYKTVTQKWHVTGMPSLMVARTRAFAIKDANDTIVVIGGVDAASSPVSTVEILNRKKKVWESASWYDDIVFQTFLLYNYLYVHCNVM